MDTRTVEFDGWPDARNYITDLRDEGYKQDWFYSYKDGSGYAVLVNEWEWRVVRIGWGIG